MLQKQKNIVFLTVMIGVVVSLALIVGDRRYQTKATYSEFIQQVQSGEVTKATIAVARTGADSVDYILKNGARLQTIVPGDYKDALAAMTANKVAVEIREASQWWQILLNMTPFLLLLGFWFLMLGQLRNKPGSPPRTT